MAGKSGNLTGRWRISNSRGRGGGSKRCGEIITTVVVLGCTKRRHVTWRGGFGVNLKMTTANRMRQILF